MFFELHFWGFLLVVVQIRDQLMQSMRNSHPRVRIVIAHRLNSDLNSVFSLQATGCKFRYGSSFGVPSDPTFWVRWFSSLGKAYSRHATDSVNCQYSSVCFVMKYCPHSTVFRNPASIQTFINCGCGSFSTRSLCLCNKFSCARISIECVGVIVNKSAGAKCGSDCSATTSSCSWSTATALFTLIWEQFQSYLHRRSIVLIILHLLCFWAFLETMDLWLGKLGVRSLRIWSSSIQRLLSHSPPGLSL